MDRRTFLKIAGIGSLSVAAGCSRELPEKKLYSLVHHPDDMVTGKPTWYASTCRECPAGCGVIAKNREGRAIKVEGNPLHPINRGSLCMRGQAAVQAVYHPDRLQRPLLRDGDDWRPISFAEAEKRLAERVQAAPGGTRFVSELVGDVLLGAMTGFQTAADGPAPLLFEPYAYEALKAANRAVFGRDGLPSYRMEEADCLVSLGADFLETWLSPVEYAWKFKAIHAVHDDQKAPFFHVAPFLSLTGANADAWLSCRAGAEAVVALGCIREALAAGRGAGLPDHLRVDLASLVAPYTPEAVVRLTGVDAQRYWRLYATLLDADTPLVLGQGVGADAMGGLQANTAANLLNLVLDPSLSLLDFESRHRVERAAPRSAVNDCFAGLADGDGAVLLLHNVNPAFTLSPDVPVAKALERDDLFTVCFSNFMDETAAMADLIFPVRSPLESWDEYGGKSGVVSTLQPAMGMLTKAPTLGDLLLRLTHGKGPADMRTAVHEALAADGVFTQETEWLATLQRGGRFPDAPTPESAKIDQSKAFLPMLQDAAPSEDATAPILIAAPSIRFFDGRNANRSWLAEYPDPITKVAWQSTVTMNPETRDELGVRDGQFVAVETKAGTLQAAAYGYEGVRPGVLVTAVGQGHTAYGRYAKGYGANPLALLPGATGPEGIPAFATPVAKLDRTGKKPALPHTDGSKTQHGRTLAIAMPIADLQKGHAPAKEHDAGHGDHGVGANGHGAGAHGGGHGVHDKYAAASEIQVHTGGGFAMHEYPFVLPLPEGYEDHRDVYPPHEHQNDYRWGMAVDLDRCIGCGACSVACYAENNLGVVGEERIVEGREMSWLRIERYHDPGRMERVTFFPMLCQHCDNAPCESVCPVYAPHHGKEGMNNQIYNRCIGTRYCSQNCPYKVRRFNWFDWDWPSPLNLQLNPDVTVRSKGVMEKCSFCVQRIKEGHDNAKDEGRRIRDGEVIPACVQTCPTGALTFGNLADPHSRVRRRIDHRRAYQALGYLNTKPAVIYLKKVIQEI